MGFSEKQLKALRRNLDHRRVRTRFANGRELSYIEGWYAVSQAKAYSALMPGVGRQLNPAAC